MRNTDEKSITVVNKLDQLYALSEYQKDVMQRFFQKRQLLSDYDGVDRSTSIHAKILDSLLSDHERLKNFIFLNK